MSFNDLVINEAGSYQLVFDAGWRYRLNGEKWFCSNMNAQVILALAGMRRALIEAWQYLNYRILFDERAVEKPLIRTKFHELGGLYMGNFLLVWRTLEALDNSEAGNQTEKELLRVLIPMAKWWTADSVVYLVRECMELQGGNGYIEEDFVMPKLFRDVNVLPIWEGSGNVIVLNILRAIQKSEGMEILLAELEGSFDQTGLSSGAREIWENTAGQIRQLNNLKPEQTEATARPLFQSLIRFAQLHLIGRAKYGNQDEKPWLEPARHYLESVLVPGMEPVSPVGREVLKGLLGWEQE